MRRLVEIPMNGVAEKYVQDVLLLKPKGLSNLVHRQIANWDYAAVAPQGTSKDKLGKFQSGGLCTVSESRNWLFHYCESQLKNYSEIKFLVEEFLDVPIKVWEGAPRGVIGEVWGGSVIYWADLFADNNNEIAIVNALSCVVSFDRTILIVVPTNNNLGSLGFARNVLSLFVAAYDQESFVICRPTRASG